MPSTFTFSLNNSGRFLIWFWGRWGFTSWAPRRAPRKKKERMMVTLSVVVLISEVEGLKRQPLNIHKMERSRKTIDKEKAISSPINL